jgi:hypothetical protein
MSLTLFLKPSPVVLFDLFFFFGEFEQEFGMYNQQEELPFSVLFFFVLFF